MSNETSVTHTEHEPYSPSPFATQTASSGGATTTPFDSNIRSSTQEFNGTPLNSGGSAPSQLRSDTAALACVDSATDTLDQINEIVDRIADARGESTLQSLLHDGAMLLGAEHAFFVSFTKSRGHQSARRFMLACDPAWCRDYVESGLATHDPWLAYAANHSQPIVASSLKICDQNRQRAVDLAARHGFVSAVLAPAHTGPRHSSVSLLCLGSATPGHFEASRAVRLRCGARTLACEIHGWWLRRAQEELVATSHITDAELDLLRRQCLGQTSKRIAAELRVTKSSINSRFQRLNSKLGVPNRRTAARLLSECGVALD